MKYNCFLLLLGIGLVCSLMAGCYLPAAPDVTPTPSQEELIESGMATAAAQALWEQATATAVAFLSPIPSETPTPFPTVVATETPSPMAESVSAPAEASPVPIETPSPTPALLPTPEAAAVATGGERTHVVQPGEWLLQIARQYGVDWRDLAAYNNILNPNRIYPGQVLRIPGAGGQPPSGNEILYTVQPGDNLFRIALRYNLNYLYLASYNGIANPHHIRVGQVIRIPVSP
ncbi:MAG: LysM peptidoglycan-binding domain-containing protein [Anaerolineae bacterium]|nr:LysM peptidoglycan-binding domain-containing protein [Anaerolineae bacterium]MDW8068763.1 LysM peptidoglycan-binding domain-containing protein [Anaerolineae bacterium]